MVQARDLMDKTFLVLKVAAALAILAIYLKWRSRLVSSQQLVSAINQLAGRMVSNKARVFRYTRVAQAVTGLFLLALGYYIGREHFHLITQGIRTQGTIVSYKQEYFAGNYLRASSSGSTAFMPIVKYQAGERVVQFKDWMGTNAAVLNVRVTVLYDPANPSVAMIDRPMWNWIPWAPTFAMGLFLVLVAINGWPASASRLLPPQDTPASGTPRVGVTGGS
jgi:uncharacterized protein DUF3592